LGTEQAVTNKMKKITIDLHFISLFFNKFVKILLSFELIQAI
jgi:hypothetical protein